MTLPGSISHGAHGDDWRDQKIRALEARIRAIETGRSLGASAIDDGGVLTIGAGGAIKLVAASDYVVFQVGNIAAYTRPDGSPQSVVLINRDTGEPAFLLGDTIPTDGYQQAWQWYDRAGNVVFAEDTTSGQGLARPYLPIGDWVDYTGSTIKTSSTTYATLQACFGYRHHPNVRATVFVVTDAATTGNVQIVTAGGQVIGTPYAAAAGAAAVIDFGPVVAPADEPGIPERVIYYLQAEVTSGTGQIGVQGLGIFGLQS